MADRLTLARISSWQIDRRWRYFVSINYVLLWLHFGKENIMHIFSEVLTYHLVKGTVYSIGLSNGMVPTVEGRSVNVMLNSGKDSL